MKKLCSCGCGREVISPTATMIKGHYKRTKKVLDKNLIIDEFVGVCKNVYKY